MSEMERYKNMYFEDCAELLKNKHSYRKHVDKFIEYLKEVGLENRPKAIDKKVVEDCIGYYRLERGELNTRSTMEAHLEALKSFYDYLSRTDKLPDIFTDYDYKDYKEAARHMVRISERIDPAPERTAVYQKKYEKYLSISNALDTVWGQFEV